MGFAQSYLPEHPAQVIIEQQTSGMDSTTPFPLHAWLCLLYTAMATKCWQSQQQLVTWENDGVGAGGEETEDRNNFTGLTRQSNVSRSTYLVNLTISK